MRLYGDHDVMETACFSGDGRMLAAACFLGDCRVWNSSTGALLRTIPGGEGRRICSVWWGRDWVLEKQRVVAFAMGHHPRLGAGSQVLGLDEELVRMIIDWL